MPRKTSLPKCQVDWSIRFSTSRQLGAVVVEEIGIYQNIQLNLPEYFIVCTNLNGPSFRLHTLKIQRRAEEGNLCRYYLTCAKALHLKSSHDFEITAAYFVFKKLRLTYVVTLKGMLEV